jgi:hypothetical protein
MISQALKKQNGNHGRLLHNIWENLQLSEFIKNLFHFFLYFYYFLNLKQKNLYINCEK